MFADRPALERPDGIAGRPDEKDGNQEPTQRDIEDDQKKHGRCEQEHRDVRKGVFHSPSIPERSSTPRPRSTQTDPLPSFDTPPGGWEPARMRIRPLGPRGEGWTIIQVALMFAIIVAGGGGPSVADGRLVVAPRRGDPDRGRGRGHVGRRRGRAPSLPDPVPEAPGTRTAAGGRRL